MQARDLEAMVEAVKRGRLSRRGFIERMLTFGIAAPFATQLLSMGGVAMAAPSPDYAYKPTKAGGGGTLKLLWWQGPTLLNPHFAVGTKDQDGSRLFYEPLASWDSTGELRAVLAAELPTLQNGGLSEDGTTVIWKLKQGVKWHDGEPFTADDVVFNWAYASDPATAAVTSGSYTTNKAEKIDTYTVKVTFKKPSPFWADPFVGLNGMLIPKHLFEPYIGAKSREAPTNFKPVGTGAYLFKEFRPGDLVSGTLNPHYHVANQPYFDAFEMKGGGDATSAARAVLQTGEYDLAWNMQIEDEVLSRLEAAGKGKARATRSGNIEFIALNFTDPNVEVDGERSSLRTRHPTFSDPQVRHAMSLLVDRESIHKYIYGRTGEATANFVNNPKQFRSTATSYEFSVDKAIAILDKAGYKPNGDGVREKDGHALKYLFQTSVNGPRQKTQQLIKQACKKAGIELELKAITPSVFFSSDVGNPDTYPHFYADLEMYTTTMQQPDPGVFMQMFLSSEAAQKSNKWQGRNITRWQSPDYDKAFAAAQSELDPTKRIALCKTLNDMVVDQVVVIPVVARPAVAAIINGLVCELSGFDSYVWDLHDWYKTS